MPVLPPIQTWTVVTVPDEATIRRIIREELEALQGEPQECLSRYLAGPYMAEVHCLRPRGHSGPHRGVASKDGLDTYEWHDG